MFIQGLWTVMFTLPFLNMPPLAEVWTSVVSSCFRSDYRDQRVCHVLTGLHVHPRALDSDVHIALLEHAPFGGGVDFGSIELLQIGLSRSACLSCVDRSSCSSKGSGQ